MLNKQGPGKIDWTDWSWNPITGCKHGCPYCYMLRMEKRFPGTMEPAFKPEYLDRFQTVRKVKSGDKVFVGSSGDMWGEWVPKEWIHIFFHKAVRKRPDVIFQFLTKNPERYWEFDFSEFKNCWFGTTVDGTERTKDNLSCLVCSIDQKGLKFVSFEPLIEEPKIDFDHFSELDWIIIGADSTRGAKKPPKAWADHLIETARQYDIPVFVKDNYGYPEVIKEFPAPDKTYIDFMKSLGTAIQGKPVDNKYLKANQ
jgi:protein gp37